MSKSLCAHILRLGAEGILRCHHIQLPGEEGQHIHHKIQRAKVIADDQRAATDLSGASGALFIIDLLFEIDPLGGQTGDHADPAEDIINKLHKSSSFFLRGNLADTQNGLGQEEGHDECKHAE